MTNARTITRHLALVAVIATLAACSRGDEPILDDAHASSLALEGAALETELSASPVREAPEPFARLGLRYDGPDGATLEVQTSADGKVWSTWQPVRVHEVVKESQSGFVAEHVVEGEPALFYRLRSRATRPTFVAMEFLPTLAVDGPAAETHATDGEHPGEPDEVAAPDGEAVDSISSALRVGGVLVQDRRSWGARPPRCSCGRHVPNRVTIHHTVTPTNDPLSPKARLRQIQAYHQRVNGWCDIGYNFLVSRDGRLWKGRGARTVGAHVTNSNTGNVGISFLGTYTSVKANRAQVNAVARLIAGLRKEFGIKISRRTVKGHRQYGGTACPGNRLYDQIGTIVNRARQ